ncbi:MAG: hypothetical protein AAGK97_05085 [Bacteroidota bacterium]
MTVSQMMRNYFLFALLFLSFMSCQKEDVSTNPIDAQNSTIQNFTNSNSRGGGGDECFTVQYPINIIFPDGNTLAVNSDDELDNAIDDWYENNEDEDDPTLEFPINVTLQDGTEQTINNENDLDDLLEACGYYDDDDDDYDDEEEEDCDLLEICFDINYPITIIFPDGMTTDVNNDDELETAIDDWFDNNPDNDEDPTVQFPIDVTLEDGTVETINNEDELDDLIDLCEGEDDDEEDDDEDDEYEDEEDCDLLEICFDINYPITIIFPDGMTTDVNNDDELETTIDDWFDNNPDSDEDPTVQFPIDVTLEDGTFETINDEDELDDLIDLCEGEDDDDICFDFVYPITVEFPDESTESVDDDDALEDAIDDWFDNNPDSDVEPTLQFPVEIEYEDGSTETLDSESALDDAIEDCD